MRSPCRHFLCRKILSGMVRFGLGSQSATTPCIGFLRSALRIMLVGEIHVNGWNNGPRAKADSIV